MKSVPLGSRMPTCSPFKTPRAMNTRDHSAAPAAISRKVALAENNGEIEIWGDGEQTRTFMYVDDCVEGLIRLMESDYSEPLNLGTDRLISINELVDLISKIAGKRLVKQHELGKPQGVRGRNSDNTKLKQVLGWEPSIPLEAGLEATYSWIENELVKSGLIRPPQAVYSTAGAVR